MRLLPLLRCSSVLAVALGLSACANPSLETRLGTHPRTIAVAEQVAKPPRMKNSSAGNLRDADLGLEPAVRNAVVEELRRSGQFAVVGAERDFRNGTRPDLLLALRIVDYGLGREGFSGRFQPTLKVQGTITRGDNGQLVRRDSEEVEEKDYPAVGHRMAEYQEHPELMREDYTSAARAVAVKLRRRLLGH